MNGKEDGHYCSLCSFCVGFCVSICSLHVSFCECGGINPKPWGSRAGFRVCGVELKVFKYPVAAVSLVHTFMRKHCSACSVVLPINLHHCPDEGFQLTYFVLFSNFEEGSAWLLEN